MTTSTPKTVLGTVRPGSTHMVGDGFHVRNLFPSNRLGEAISPFLLFDYAGPTQYGPRDPEREGPRGVGEHPHRGFETVTIVYQGRVAHRDSAGNAGVIGPGDVQWMTAAAGIVHEEFHDPEFTRSGGVLQMVQLWVNLPAKHKLSQPKYQAITADAIPRVELAGGTGLVRVIAGEHAGARGPASTFTPLDVWDVRLAQGAQLGFDVPAGRTAAVVVLEGAIAVNGSEPVGDAELALLSREGTRVALRAAQDSTLLFLSGEPLGEPVVQHGPFVMNTGAEIHQAIQDYQQGRMGRLDA
ncbi:MAG: pirin family protein [Planctomycetes bacterium]|nr:pirin family protein [Planctomycetota bacterium]